MYMSVVTNMPAGTTSMVITNKGLFPYRLVSVQVQSEAVNTNTFSVTKECTIRQPLWAASVVSTNQFGEVETNSYHGVTNTIVMTHTNVLYSMAFTNVTGTTVLNDELPEDVWFLGGDVLKINAVSTRSAPVWLILNALR